MVRTSWVSVTLAAALGVTMPLAATMAGTALAAPIAVPQRAVVRRGRGTHPGARARRGAPRVLTADGAITGDVPTRAKAPAESPRRSRSTHGVGPRERPGARAGRRLDRAPEPVVVVPRHRHGRGRPRSTTASRSCSGWTRSTPPAPGAASSSPTCGRAATAGSRSTISRASRPSSTSTSTCPNIASASTSATSSCTPCRRDRHVVDPHPTGALRGHRPRPVPVPGARSDRSRSGSAGSSRTCRPGGAAGTSSRSTARTTPSSIGTSASAGCVRVSEWALERFEPLLRLGTPVVIHG